MLRHRLEAAHKIAHALGPAETDIDTAISSTSRLIAAIADGRRDARVHFNMGQQGLTALGETMTALLAARSSLVAAHSALAQDRIEAGLRTYSMGDVGDCPPAPSGLALVGGQDRTAA